MTVKDRAARRWAPRAIVALSGIDWPARVAARARRMLGRGGRVELYYAYDDPASAVAVLDLARRVRSREVALVLAPVVHRGLALDPAREDKRRYALEDAGRRARRAGLSITRSAPLDPSDTAFLAAWTAAAPPGPGRDRFVLAALRRLWCLSDGTVGREPYADLWRTHVGGAAPPVDETTGVRRNERRMHRRGPYDVPAAWVHGRWFFAQDRPDQIIDRLDELGWAVR